MAKKKVGNQRYVTRRLRAKEWSQFPTFSGRESNCHASDFIAIRGLHRKLCAFKVAKVLVVAISRLPLGSLGTKNHLDVAFVERRKVYYKGEGGGFPQVRVVVSLVCLSCLWFILAPKVLQLCTNHYALVCVGPCE
jgi:hypothetical protein